MFNLLMLLLAAGAAVGEINVVGVMKDGLAQPYLEEACEVTGGECPEAPIVALTPTSPTTQGFHFRGTDIVFLTSRCAPMGVFCEAILVHEMVHYVVSEQGRYVDLVCDNERLAWAAFNQYVLKHGRPDLINLDWTKYYEECQ